MTLLSQYLHIHFQFVILFISSNLKSILFLKTNEIYLFLNIEGRFFTFWFSPCVPSSNRWFTLSVFTSLFFHSFKLPLAALCSFRVPDHSSMFSLSFINFFTPNCPKYWCFYFLHCFLLTHVFIWTIFLILLCFQLFEHVALHFLSFLLGRCPIYSTPSSSFPQRAAALLMCFLFIDPYIRYVMFLHMWGVPKSSKSCHYILPRFSNFVQVIFIHWCRWFWRLHFVVSDIL